MVAATASRDIREARSLQSDRKHERHRLIVAYGVFSERSFQTMEKRYRLQFYGFVQGVGFRYTASHAANMYRLTGYVRNEYDGSVTCEVQGREEDIEQFLSVIMNGRFIHVTSIDRTELALEEQERSFQVRY